MKKFFAMAIALVMGFSLVSCSDASPKGEGEATYKFEELSNTNASVANQLAIDAAYVAAITVIPNSKVGKNGITATGVYAEMDGIVTDNIATAEKAVSALKFGDKETYKVQITVTYATGKTRTLYKASLPLK